jgi:hypothetical protein
MYASHYGGVGRHARLKKTLDFIELLVGQVVDSDVEIEITPDLLGSTEIKYIQTRCPDRRV